MKKSIFGLAALLSVSAFASDYKCELFHNEHVRLRWFSHKSIDGDVDYQNFDRSLMLSEQVITEGSYPEGRSLFHSSGDGEITRVLEYKDVVRKVGEFTFSDDISLGYRNESEDYQHETYLKMKDAGTEEENIFYGKTVLALDQGHKINLRLSSDVMLLHDQRDNSYRAFLHFRYGGYNRRLESGHKSFRRWASSTIFFDAGQSKLRGETSLGGLYQYPDDILEYQQGSGISHSVELKCQKQ